MLILLKMNVLMSFFPHFVHSVTNVVGLSLFISDVNHYWWEHIE